MIEHVRRRADEFDVLHFHIDYFPLSLFMRQHVAVPDDAARAARPAGIQAVVYSISRRAARLDLEQPAPAAARPQLGATVYHGMPGKPADAAAAGESRTTSPFLGRISPEKGIDAAIRIAGALRHEAEDRGQGR